MEVHICAIKHHDSCQFTCVSALYFESFPFKCCLLHGARLRSTSACLTITNRKALQK